MLRSVFTSGLFTFLAFAALPVLAQPQRGTTEVIPLNTGTKFLFKGLAVDVRNQLAYLGSWDKKEIVVVDLNKKTHAVIPTKYSGRLNAMGVYLREHILYAVMNEVNDNPAASPVSALVLVDTRTRAVLRSYELRGNGGRHHFNHVAVDANGIAYISNTLRSAICKVDTKDQHASIRLLIEHRDLSWVHGIDLSPDGKRLFCTSYHGGIKFLNLEDNTFSPYRDTLTSENDGLKYHEGSLFGIGKNSLKRYKLNEAQTAVVSTEVVLPDHPFFNDPRCLHIEDGWIYCLANTAFGIVSFDQSAAGSTYQKESFRDSYLIRYKL